MDRNFGSRPSQGNRDPLSTDAQRQLRESYGGPGRQRGLGGKPQAVPQICCSAPELPEGHPALPERAAAGATASTQVSHQARRTHVNIDLDYLFYCFAIAELLLLHIPPNRKTLKGFMLSKQWGSAFFSRVPKGRQQVAATCHE